MFLCIILAGLCRLETVRIWSCGFRPGMILGASPGEIQSVYGPFDRLFTRETGETTGAEYCLREDRPNLIMGRDDSLWLRIGFDRGIYSGG